MLHPSPILPPASHLVTGLLLQKSPHFIHVDDTEQNGIPPQPSTVLSVCTENFWRHRTMQSANRNGSTANHDTPMSYVSQDAAQPGHQNLNLTIPTMGRSVAAHTTGHHPLLMDT